MYKLLSNKILLLLTTFLFPLTSLASNKKEQQMLYSYELIGSGTTGNYIPFFSVSNKYGIISPLDNGLYVRGNTDYTFNYQKLAFQAGVDIIGTTISSNYYEHNLFLQQLYASLSYSKIELMLGQREEEQLFVNNNLSSGNLIYSNNTRPYPKMQLKTKGFVSIPFTNQWLNIKFGISYGKPLDSNYEIKLADNYSSDRYGYGFKNGHYIFIENPILHRKDLFISTKPTAPIILTVGFEHTGYFGGTQYIDNTKYNSGFQNAIDVFFNKKWDETGDYTLQYAYTAAIDFKIEANLKKFKLGLYTQNYLEYNQLKGIFSTDNLWGLEFNNKNRKSIVTDGILEYLIFSNQGYSAFHGTYYQDVPFGSWSHYGMCIGTPMCVSPIYNEDKNPTFTKSLCRGIHLGISGVITDKIDYKLKMMYLKTWGSNFRYLPDPIDSFSINIEGSYQLPKGYHICPSIGVDSGKIFGNNIGGTLTIRKIGLLAF